MKKICSIILTIVMILSMTTISRFSFIASATSSEIQICEEHTYTSECDAVCEVCQTVREVEHTLNSRNKCSVCSTEFNYCGNNILWSIQDKVLLLEGTGEMYNYDFWSYTVPWEYELENITKVFVSDGITTIGTNAFCDFVNLTEVELPSTVQKFGMNAFALCQKLTEITIPSGLVYIDTSAFANCYTLQEFKVADGNTNFSVENGVLFNKNKTSLWAYPIGTLQTIYEMPHTVERIEAYAFSNAENLQEIIFSQNLKHIDDEAFHSCIGLTEITLPYGFKSIGGGAFQDCFNLSSINLPEDMSRIGPLAFDQTAYYNDINNWENQVVLYLDNYVLQARESWDDVDGESGIELTGDYTVKNDVTLIADEAFDFLYDLTSVELPYTLQYIGEGAFCYCKGLTEIDIPGSVTHIGEIAFMGCALLSDVDLPSRLQRIGYSAFEDTPYLNSVVTEENPIGYRSNYVIGAHSSLTVANIKEGITLIAENAFENAKNVTEITLPESLKYVGDNAFINTSRTKNITVPKTVEYIGDFSFGYNKIYDWDLDDYVLSNIAGFSLSGYTDSVAEEYAKKFAIPFNYLDGCNHDYIQTTTTPNSCFVPGICTYTCNLCGDSYTAEIPAAHTNVVIDPAIEPGCNTEGKTEGSHCEACGEIFVEQFTLSPLYHHVITIDAISPDCNTEGKTEGVWCEDCQKYLVEPEDIPPTGNHRPFSYSDVPATCTKTGLTGGTFCGLCGEQLTPQTVVPTNNNHTKIVIDEGYRATCTTDGATNGSHCEDCGKVVSPQQPILSSGHTWDYRYTIDKAATESQAGYMTRRCTAGCNAFTDLVELPPFAPINIENTNNGLKLSWNPYPRIYAYYYIYRMETSAETPSGMQYITTTTETSFIDTTAKAGCSYEYLFQVKDGNSQTVATARTTEITIGNVNKNPIKIIAQPKTTTVKSGSIAEVSVAATGDGLTYQWYVKNSGATKFSKSSYTTSYYSVKMSDTTKDRAVYCVITDKYGQTVKTNTVYLRMSCTHKYSNACDTSCNICKATRKVSHNYKTTITKATLAKNGSIIKKCTVCKDVSSNKTIKYAKTIKLSSTSYTYDGKVKKPTVTVKDSAGKTISSSNYTVKYASGRKNVGTYKVTITFKSNYSGTKTLTFKINPARTTISKLTAGKKSITVAITKKSTQVTGYEIQYSTSKKFTSAKTKTISSYKTTKTTIKSLSAKKTYYVRVRTYKTVNGKKYYSSWSYYKSIKTK